LSVCQLVIQSFSPFVLSSVGQSSGSSGLGGKPFGFSRNTAALIKLFTFPLPFGCACVLVSVRVCGCGVVWGCPIVFVCVCALSLCVDLCGYFNPHKYKLSCLCVCVCVMCVCVCGRCVCVWVCVCVWCVCVCVSCVCVCVLGLIRFSLISQKIPHFPPPPLFQDGAFGSWVCWIYSPASLLRRQSLIESKARAKAMRYFWLAEYLEILSLQVLLVSLG